MSKKKTYGTCKLCLKENVVLQKSHYIPKALYRLSREEGRNPS